MNHQPFETWIYNEEALEPGEQQKLNDHLQSCEECRRLSLAMEGVRQTFRAAPSPAPAPGFTQRWKARLAVHKQVVQQRQMWILTLTLFGLASLISTGILLLQFRQIIWFYEISQIIANFSLFAARINLIWVMFRSINETLPFLAPIMVVFGVGGLSAAIALIVTWFSSMVQLYLPAD